MSPGPGGGGRDGEGRARARPRAAAPGYSAPPPHAHNMAGWGARRSRGDRGRCPQTSEAQLPSWDRAHAGPLGTRALFQAELDSGSSQGRAPSTPLFFRGEGRLPSPRFGGPCFCLSACPGAGVFIPSLQMLLGGAFSPAKIKGLRRWVFASPRYPDVASPCAPQMTGERVSNLSFRTCTWCVSSLPSASSLCSGKGSHISPTCSPLEFRGAKPPHTHALWKLFGGRETSRPLNVFGAWL